MDTIVTKCHVRGRKTKCKFKTAGTTLYLFAFRHDAMSMIGVGKRFSYEITISDMM